MISLPPMDCSLVLALLQTGPFSFFFCFAVGRRNRCSVDWCSGWFLTAHYCCKDILCSDAVWRVKRVMKTEVSTWGTAALASTAYLYRSFHHQVKYRYYLHVSGRTARHACNPISKVKQMPSVRAVGPPNRSVSKSDPDANQIIFSQDREREREHFLRNPNSPIRPE